VPEDRFERTPSLLPQRAYSEDPLAAATWTRLGKPQEMENQTGSLALIVRIKHNTIEQWPAPELCTGLPPNYAPSVKLEL